MKNTIIFSAFLVVACSFQACQNTSKDENSSVRRMDLAEGDFRPGGDDTTGFLALAAVGGKMEVELGTMAQMRAKNALVKEFGAMMVKDHSKANAEIQTLAEARKMVLPTMYSKKTQRHINDLKELNPKAFEKHYISMMVEDHEKDIALFKAATKHSDTSISRFATKTLPILEAHLKAATAIKSSLE